MNIGVAVRKDFCITTLFYYKEKLLEKYDRKLQNHYSFCMVRKCGMSGMINLSQLLREKCNEEGCKKWKRKVG